MIGKITLEQEMVLCDFFRQGLGSLGLSHDGAHEIIKSRESFWQGIRPVLKNLSLTDKRFGPSVREFSVLVPREYNHETQVDTVAKSIQSDELVGSLDSDFTSLNFAKATDRLVPGKVYLVKVIPVLVPVTGQDILDFLKKQGALFVGAQGAMFVYEHLKFQFPVGRWTLSFDNKEALFVNKDACHSVPTLYRSPGGIWGFHLPYFESNLFSGKCLLCICED